MDAVWDGRSDGSTELGLGIGPQERVIFGSNVGCPHCNQCGVCGIVANSQITLGFFLIPYWVVYSSFVLQHSTSELYLCALAVFILCLIQWTYTKTKNKRLSCLSLVPSIACAHCVYYVTKDVWIMYGFSCERYFLKCRVWSRSQSLINWQTP